MFNYLAVQFRQADQKSKKRITKSKRTMIDILMQIKNEMNDRLKKLKTQTVKCFDRLKRKTTQRFDKLQTKTIQLFQNQSKNIKDLIIRYENIDARVKNDRFLRLYQSINKIKIFKRVKNDNEFE